MGQVGTGQMAFIKNLANNIFFFLAPGFHYHSAFPTFPAEVQSISRVSSRVPGLMPGVPMPLSFPGSC